MIWTKRGNTHIDEEYAGNNDFVRQVVLDNEKLLELKQRKWDLVQQGYPYSTTKKFEEFWNRVWSCWVREKKKLATRKVKEVRRKNKRKEKQASSLPSDESAVRSSIPITAPSIPIRSNPPDPTTSPQMPPFGPNFNNNDCLDEIVVQTSHKPRTTTPLAASKSPLLPPISITTPKSTPTATPGSVESSSTASRKRSYDETFSPSIGPTTAWERYFRRKVDVGNFLAQQLKEHLVQGLLSRRAVIQVLEDTEMLQFLQSDESGRATADSIVQGINPLHTRITEDINGNSPGGQSLDGSSADNDEAEADTAMQEVISDPLTSRDIPAETGGTIDPLSLSLSAAPTDTVPASESIPVPPEKQLSGPTPPITETDSPPHQCPPITDPQLQREQQPLVTTKPPAISASNAPAEDRSSQGKQPQVDIVPIKVVDDDAYPIEELEDDLLSDKEGDGNDEGGTTSR